MYGLFAVILALSLTGCPPEPGPGGDPATITYTATQDGGTDGTVTSTGIVFTFSASVGSLNVADITVGGAASKGSATLSGSGTTWTLSTITVNSAGLATVSINKTGIETATKNITIHKAGETTPTEYRTIAWNFNGGTPGAGAQHPTQIAKDAVLAQPSPNPTKANSTFGGWYTDSGLTQTYDFTSPVTANLSLYAKWEAGSQPPTHTHQWGAWTATTIAGTEQRVCGTDQSHIEHRLTGTDRFTFAPASDTSYCVSKGRVTTGELRIPAYYRQDANSGYLSVTAISNGIDGNAFEGTSITAVHIPDTVTTIGDGAFYNCTSLTSVTIGASVTTIDWSAFYNCSSLTSITIPASVTTILGNAFSSCTNLESITIGASVTTLGHGAFSNCTSLASINIPASVSEIEDSAFYNCSSLTSITIPASVTSIRPNVFYGWTASQTIYVPWTLYNRPSGWHSQWNNGCNAQIVYQGE